MKKRRRADGEAAVKRLLAVDRLEIPILVDNSTDMLSAGRDRAGLTRHDTRR
jgi:hypothetical protein